MDTDYVIDRCSNLVRTGAGVCWRRDWRDWSKAILEEKRAANNIRDSSMKTQRYGRTQTKQLS